MPSTPTAGDIKRLEQRVAELAKKEERLEEKLNWLEKELREVRGRPEDEPKEFTIVALSGHGCKRV